MKKQHLFLYRLFSASFDTQQSKDDVIVRNNDVIMDLTFTAFERLFAIVPSCHVWW